MKRGTIVEWRLWFVLALLVGLASCALGQWDQVTRLTSFPDTLVTNPELRVDSLFHLHLFYRTQSYVTTPPREYLCYRRFDSWGNQLTQPMIMQPDTPWSATKAGVFLDRSGTLHVLWNSWNRWAPPWHTSLNYARLNPQGEFLAPVADLAQPDTMYYSIYGANMVQTQSGDIWVSYGQYFFVLNEQGQIITPLTRYVQDASVSVAHLQRSPDDHVWACFRYTVTPAQNVSLMRIDTTVRTPEVVTPNDDPFLQVNVEAFFIDSLGAFHYILYRDDSGLFYQRDARDGSPPDTSVLDSTPYGDGSTQFTLIGGDTLMYIWGESEPQSGIWRIGFNLDGDRVVPPTFTSHTHFGVESKEFSWYRGSYWVPGMLFASPGVSRQIGMIHVPGPNEPANIVNDPYQAPIAEQPDVFTFPQPTNGAITFRSELFERNSYGTVTIFNTLGQQVNSLQLSVGDNGSLIMRLPDGLAVGRYFAKIEVGSHTVVRPFIYFP